jgi:D-alanyl-D-alanine carboxypeptidase/D-alanyl-D-alanine-endopeptidase (penicillin-binding protein 4)
VSPAFLVRLLRELCSGPHGRLVLQSLARGGVDGTLRKRFRQTPQLGQVVHAKTGTINGVKALSGMVQLPSGRLRLFSIIMNRRKGTSMRGVSRLQEQMVHAMYTQD